MKAITLIQPWATLVALRVKQIETRSWATKHRGPLAIHSSNRIPRDVRARLRDPEDPLSKVIFRATGAPADQLLMPLGKVLCIVKLEDCVKTSWCLKAQGCDGGGWSRGQARSLGGPGGDPRIFVAEQEYVTGNLGGNRSAWLLTHLMNLDPFPARGQMGLWECEVPIPEGGKALLLGMPAPLNLQPQIRFIPLQPGHTV